MFERFTDRARRVCILASEEARLLNHDYIGTEHLLLGLIHEGEGVAAQALAMFGLNLEEIRKQVEEVIGRGMREPVGHIPFTPRAKKVLELSLREALELGHNYIGTEHILLGLVREGEGVAAKVMAKCGLEDLGVVRRGVLKVLRGAPSEQPKVLPKDTTALDRYRQSVRTVDCSYCNAKQGEPCVSTDRLETYEYVHDGRSLAWHMQMALRILQAPFEIL